MCRLLYVNSKNKFSTAEFLSKFAEISKNSKEFQGHGWGCAYFQNGKWNYYKNVNPIWEDDLSQFGDSNRLIAHARSAFKDEGIAVENNMPFYDDKYIFIFNGELKGVKIKEDGKIGGNVAQFNGVQLSRLGCRGCCCLSRCRCRGWRGRR